MHFIKFLLLIKKLESRKNLIFTIKAKKEEMTKVLTEKIVLLQIKTISLL